jgi:hypothetical protein
MFSGLGSRNTGAFGSLDPRNSRSSAAVFGFRGTVRSQRLLANAANTVAEGLSPSRIRLAIVGNAYRKLSQMCIEN